MGRPHHPPTLSLLFGRIALESQTFPHCAVRSSGAGDSLTRCRAAPRAPLPPPRAAASASAVPPPPPPPPPSVTLLSVCFSILSYLIYLAQGSVVSSTHPPSLARAGARARASRRCSARIMAPPSHTSPSLCRSERISSRPARLRLGAWLSWKRAWRRRQNSTAQRRSSSRCRAS